MARRDETLAVEEGVAPPSDSLLLRYTGAASEDEAEPLLEDLVSFHARPLVTRVLRQRFAGLPSRARGHEAQNLDDVAARVMLQLVARLRVLRASPRENDIASFERYVVSAALRAYYQYLRERYPRRHRLKNRLRHLFTTDADFALWRVEGRGWVCGLSSRDSDRRVACRPEASAATADHRGRRGRTRPDGAQALGPLVEGVLRTAGRPIAFDALVSAVAERMGVEEDVALDPDEDLGPSPLARGGRSPWLMTQVDYRIYLRQLWPRVMDLSLRQRTALLLNLTDSEGRDLLALLPATGVASLREIARVLEMSAERLAALWNDLPLDDLTLARHLGLTRQQVINLRSDARRRLARRAGIAPSRLREARGGE